MKGLEWKARLPSRRKGKVREVRQTEKEGWKAIGFDQEVTNCGQQLDSRKCFGSWRGCEVEESCTWPEGAARGVLGFCLVQNLAPLGRIWN